MTNTEEVDTLVAGIQIAYQIVLKEKEASKIFAVQTALLNVLTKIEKQIEKYANQDKIQRIITL